MSADVTTSSGMLGDAVPIPTLPFAPTYKLGEFGAALVETIKLPETCKVAVGVVVPMPTLPLLVMRMASFVPVVPTAKRISVGTMPVETVPLTVANIPAVAIKLVPS
jgi:hypothetical protein